MWIVFVQYKRTGVKLYELADKDAADGIMKRALAYEHCVRAAKVYCCGW